MSTYYIATAAGGGSDANPGTLAQPWATLAHAVTVIASGDLVLVRGGLYQVAALTFTPKGLSPAQRTTFRAYTAERPVFTGLDNNPINVVFQGNYIEVDGLWMGGNTQNGSNIVFDSTGPDAVSRYKSMRNCTLWNFTYMGAGHHEYTLIQNNHLWGFGTAGSPPDIHAIYLRGKDGGATAATHGLVDGNIILNTRGGYCIYAWRDFRDVIITRNFLGNGVNGVGYKGQSGLIANNLLWQGAAAGAMDIDPLSSHVRLWNNISDEPASAITFEAGQTDQLASNNARSNATASGYADGTDVIYTFGSTLSAYLNKTRAQIDTAITTLAASFAADAAVVAVDATIDANFAVLAAATAKAGGPFNNAGHAWGGGQGLQVDIGLGVPVPATEDDFWNTLYALGLPNYDSNGVAIMNSYTPAVRGQPLTIPFFVLNSSGKFVLNATFGTVKRSLDFAAPLTATNVPVEIGFGEYSITMTGAEMTCGHCDITIPVTTANCPDIPLVVYTAARTLDDLAFPLVSGRGLTVDAAGRVDLSAWLGLTPNPLLIGRVDANMGALTAPYPAGVFPYSFTVTSSAGGLPLSNALVWISTDFAGRNVIWKGLTDVFGVAHDIYGYLPLLNAGTYYAWVQDAGYTEINPTTISVQQPKWWQAGGASGCLCAYQPRGAATYAASLLDLSGANHPANAGVDPTWDPVNGWNFDGLTQFLKTGVAPATGPGLVSIFVRFSNMASQIGAYRLVFGCFPSIAPFWSIGFRTLDAIDFFNASIGSAPIPMVTNGVAGFAGVHTFVNGVQQNNTGASNVSAASEVFIGGQGYLGAPLYPALVSVQAFVIYAGDIGIVASQAVMAAMAAL